MMRRLSVQARYAAGGLPFLVLLCSLWVAAHLWRISDPPGGFHEWREADTCAVAWSLRSESFDLLHPRISVRGDGSGITGQEFPLLNAAIATGWIAFGDDQHWFARLLSVAAGVALIVGLRRLLLDLSWPRAAAGLAAAALACSPLLFFYGRKIVPDMPGAALALWGALLARRWIVGEVSWRSAAVSMLLLALTGVIKPIALCVGLPLVVVLVQHHGWKALLQPRWWCFGAACLVPMVVWFRYAGGLDSSGYFLVGVPWRRSLEALVAGWPFSKLLIEWPWQLWIGLPLVPAFLVGTVWCWRHSRTTWPWWWLGGAFVVLLPFAGQFGPHDYYTMTMVAPCAVLTGAGLAWMLAQRQRTLAAFALLVLAAAGPLAFVRISGRYGVSYDHAKIRAESEVVLPPGALVVAYDSVPAALLYRLGRNGWWIEASADLDRLPVYAAKGAGFVTARGDRRADLVGLVGEAVLERDGVTVYRLVR